MGEMNLGPIGDAEREELKEIVKQNICAFALTPDDIGSFYGFSYPLKYKKDADAY